MTAEVSTVTTRRKPAVELAPGDRLVRRYASTSRAYTVETAGPFIGDKNRPMIAVKAGTMVFHYREDDMVEIIEEE